MANSDPWPDLPLQALRACAAAAELGSFTRAAARLGITQAAVSQQVALVERHLGRRLFERLGRGVQPSDAGQVYLTAVQEALASLAQATRRLGRPSGDGVVTLTLATTIAMRWLIPRLQDFARRQPTVELRLAITERYLPVGDGEVDIGIQYGRGGPPGLESRLLFHEVLTPVASPELLAGKGRLAQPRDLLRHRLLHARGSADDWRDWLALAAVQLPDPRAGQVFDQPHLALEAAAAGLGVALADRALAASDLAAGRLIEPFNLRLTRAEGYHLVGPRERPRPALRAAWDWLRAQGEAQRV